MRRVLTVRLDAIGDAILWNGATEALRSAFPGAVFAWACRPGCEPVVRTNPFVDELIVIDPSDPEAAAETLNAWRPDVVLHPVRSREPAAEAVLARCRAAERIALRSDTANASPGQIADFDTTYTRLLGTPDAPRCELDRHGDVLRGLGVEVRPVRPRVWLTGDDHAEADRLFAGCGIEPSGAIAVFPTARWSYKLYPFWPEALSIALREMPEVTSVIALGGPEARPGAEAVRAGLSAAHPSLRLADLTGRTTLRGCLAVLARCRLVASNDTFAVHAACALGVPQAVVVGGGHLGRFLPYDPLTVVATMPLGCDGCDWRCRHARAHCIKDIPPETAAMAVRLAAGGLSHRPRIVMPGDVQRPGLPVRADPPAWLSPAVVPLTTRGARPAAS